MSRILFASSQAACWGSPLNYINAKFTVLGTNDRIVECVPPLPYSLLTLWGGGARNRREADFGG